MSDAKKVKVDIDELRLLKVERDVLREEASLHKSLRAALRVVLDDWEMDGGTTVDDCIYDVKKMLGE